MSYDIHGVPDEHKLVVLRALPRGLVLTKRITLSPTHRLTRPYDRAARFDAATMPVSGIEDLFGWLEEINPRPDLAIIRGKLINGDTAKAIPRWLIPKEGGPPTIEDCPRSWIATDHDKIDLPPKFDKTDLIGCAARAIVQLPAEFHRARFVIQATSGHGLAKGARLRLWFWLSRGVTGAEAKRWLRAAPIDHSLFTPNQLIYTARPIFENRTADILPVRLVLFPGAACVQVPDIDLAVPSASPPEGGNRYAGPVHPRQIIGIGRFLSDAGEGQGHERLVWAAFKLAEATARGEIPEPKGREDFDPQQYLIECNAAGRYPATDAVRIVHSIFMKAGTQRP